LTTSGRRLPVWILGKSYGRRDGSVERSFSLKGKGRGEKEKGFVSKKNDLDILL
jgi:hypothetical protein